MNLEYDGTATLHLYESDYPLGTKLFEKYGAKYNLKSNIVKLGISSYGQSGSMVVWLISSLGEISYFYIDISNVSIDEVKFTSLKNIIDIQTLSTPGGAQLKAIDIDGKFIDVKKLN